jgi:hypothetical protein
MPHATVSPGGLWGDQRNVPAHLLSYFQQNNVIYWSRPRQDGPVCRTIFCQTFGACVILPCLWLHLCMLSSCLCCYISYRKSEVLSTDVVLTRTTLEIIKNGRVKSIDLEKIKSITATTQPESKCSPTCCMPDMNRLIIDDGTMVYKEGSLEDHWAPAPTVVMAHDNIDEFRRLILETKTANSPAALVAAMQPQQKKYKGQYPPGQGQYPMMSQQQPIMGQYPMVGQPYPPGQYPMMSQQQPVMAQVTGQPYPMVAVHQPIGPASRSARQR